MRWQPIETAPKGTIILIFDPRNERPISVGAWGHLGLGEAYSRWYALPGAYGRKPTHWMPLPKPPVEVNP